MLDEGNNEGAGSSNNTPYGVESSPLQEQIMCLARVPVQSGIEEALIGPHEATNVQGITKQRRADPASHSIPAPNCHARTPATVPVRARLACMAAARW
jgi:hypothetical protein